MGVSTIMFRTLHQGNDRMQVQFLFACDIQTGHLQFIFCCTWYNLDCAAAMRLRHDVGWICLNKGFGDRVVC